MSDRYFLVGDMTRTVPDGREPEDVIGDRFAEALELERMPGEFEAADENGQIVLDVAAIDAALHARIDTEAGAFRCQFITDVPGQQSAYDRKEAEARDMLAGGGGPWPMIEAEAEATGLAPAMLAAAIIEKADGWAEIEPIVEATRVGAKKAVTAAEGAEAKRAAAAVDWGDLTDPDKPLPPLGGQGKGGGA